MITRTQRRLAVIAAAAVVLSGAAATAAGAATPAPSRTVGAAYPATIAFGATTSLKAVVKHVTGSAQPTGTVTFNDGATVLGTSPLALVGTSETARLSVSTLSVGTHSLTATYNGGAAFAPSTSLPFTVTVGAPSTRTAESTTTPTIGLGKNGALKAVVKQIGGTGLPTGTVTFNEGSAVTGTVALVLLNGVETAKLAVPGLTVGTHTFVATYNGSASFASSISTPVTITVTKATTTTAVVPASGTLTGDSVSITARVRPSVAGSPVATGLVTFVIDSLAPQVVALNASGNAPLGTVALTPGTHTITATYSGDSTYVGSTATSTVTAP